MKKTLIKGSSLFSAGMVLASTFAVSIISSQNTNAVPLPDPTFFTQVYTCGGSATLTFCEPLKQANVAGSLVTSHTSASASAETSPAANQTPPYASSVSVG